MGFSIEHVEVHRLFGRIDIELDFQPDINILYGRNGSGKTTLLHILANVLNGSLDRFAYLSFAMIRMRTGDARLIEIRRTGEGSPDQDRVAVTLDGEIVVVYSVNAVLQYDAAMTTSTVAANPWQISTIPLHDNSYYDHIVGASQAFAQQLKGAAYFPAFRAMIEAWRSVEDIDDAKSFRVYLANLGNTQQGREARLTSRARVLFGDFVPSVNYPSVLEIERDLGGQVEAARFAVARVGEEILSEAFVDAFAALSEAEELVKQSPLAILGDIEELLKRLDENEIVEFPEARQSDVYGRLRDAIPLLQAGGQSDTAARVLAVYRDSLYRQVALQRSAFEPIEQYIQAVNEFLEGKRVVITGTHLDRQELSVTVEFADGIRESLRSLSSGERQIVSMLYAASRMDEPRVVLIDEPELSLHIDWQRPLIGRMAQQLGDRQLIVCTHSPEIGAEFEDRFHEIAPWPALNTVQ